MTSSKVQTPDNCERTGWLAIKYSKGITPLLYPLPSILFAMNPQHCTLLKSNSRSCGICKVHNN